VRRARVPLLWVCVVDGYIRREVILDVAGIKGIEVQFLVVISKYL